MKAEGFGEVKTSFGAAKAPVSAKPIAPLHIPQFTGGHKTRPYKYRINSFMVTGL